jgi:hypothetical protein
LEGGVRVPGFVLDLSSDGRYFGKGTKQIEATLNESKLELKLKSKTGSALGNGYKTISNHMKIDKDGGRIFTGMMHISDWLPTILSIAGYKSSYRALPKGLDGFDFTSVLNGKNFTNPRNEMLLELYLNNETTFDNELFSYRIGDMKLIRGNMRDSLTYKEPDRDRLSPLNISMYSRVMIFISEKIIRILEFIFGVSRFDR